MELSNQNVKPKLIFLEGVDRVGKNSVWDEIDKQTKYKHIVVDRGPIGFMAYCDIYNKSNILFDAYVEMEKLLAESGIKVLVLYLTCDTVELIDRCVKTNHEILMFDRHKLIYESLVNQSDFKEIIKIDTTKTSAKDIVQNLIKEGAI